MTTDLKMYSNDCDFIVSTSCDEARAMLMKETGMHAEECEDLDEYDADRPMTWWVDVHGKPGEPGAPGIVEVRLTAAAFCRLLGPGYAGSTEN